MSQEEFCYNFYVKTKPYLFLFFLAIILVFILGVRYGQRVEKNNKVVDYILSITPFPTYTPYPLASPKSKDEGGLPTKSASASPTIINLKKNL